MSRGLLLEIADRVLIDTSLQAYLSILPSLKERQWGVLLALSEAIESGAKDVTGWELAERMGTFVTSTRPRLTELFEMGLIERQAARPSRVRFEGTCRPFVTVLPHAAIVRGYDQFLNTRRERKDVHRESVGV